MEPRMVSASSWWLTGALLFSSFPRVLADCLDNKEFNDYFENVDGRISDIPRFGSCCMYDVCGLQCPITQRAPSRGYSIAVIVGVLIPFIAGLSMYLFVKGSAETFFVADRSLPLFVVVMTLASQSIDSNALLGNADLSYKYGFWDGAVLPLGLALSLFINGIFLAAKVQQDNVLTLPDIFAKRYGRVVEVLVSCATISSFIMLLAGNLVGMGVVLAYVWQIEENGAIWIASAMCWAYVVSGGLYSVAYTDVIQGLVGWLGIIIFAFSVFASENTKASPPSIGFPGYIYPDGVGEGGICDLYHGIPCTPDSNATCCYNEALWCPNGLPYCDRYDRAAYPFGDKQVFKGQMRDHLAMSPFPNAIFWNWSTIFILGFGNVAALDFQARCMASKTPAVAKYGCLLAGCITLIVCVPFSFLGSIVRIYHGPDSINSVFEADTCSSLLGLPTCAVWEPDPVGFLRFVTNQVPSFIGGWCLIGIVAATMSTADGAILALGTVMANNVFRQIDTIFPHFIDGTNLVLCARLSTVPLTLGATAIAAFYRSNDDHAAGATGYLLIVAFDIVLATVVVPLFAAYFVENPSPRAALFSIIAGAISRIALEFVLDKDGSLLLPFPDAEFYDFGPAASILPPLFVNASETWDPTIEECKETQFRDFTGVDSMAAPFVSLLVFGVVQLYENIRGKPLFEIPGLVGYEKDSKDGENAMLQEWTQAGEVLFVVIGVIFLVSTVFVVLLVNAV